QPPQPKRSWNGATSTDRDGLVLTRPIEPIPIATLTPLGEAAAEPARAQDQPTPAPTPLPARRACTRCSGRPGAEVRIT
ncbi:hypothetical protein, partial [Cellulosimicrobium cellulans]|uniref:hypothetical protein n=1 Tax=Cellulosimicrobium cellulans TaxID=1710 RepID=UPI001C9E90A7